MQAALSMYEFLHSILSTTHVKYKQQICVGEVSYIDSNITFQSLLMQIKKISFFFKFGT